jgi:hypothetical protein
MKYHWVCLIAFGAVALTSCTTGTTGSASRTNVPAAPVNTGSASSEIIPAGTTLVIRTNDRIEATTANAGEHYSAEVAQDVVNDRGQVLIPRGSPATLTVLNASPAGAVGTSNLELALASVQVGGRKYTVTSDVQQQSGKAGIGANRRTAEMVGGGAALGALIGAVAGGGAGAVAGGAIGAAGGAAAQVLTRGNEVRVPAESVLTFRLENPITLQG